MKKYFIFLFFIQLCYSQNDKNIAFEKNLKISEEYLKSFQLDSACFYAIKAKDIAEKSSNKKLMLTSYLAVAKALSKKGHKNEAYNFGIKAEKIALEIRSTEPLLSAWLLLGNIHFENVDDDAALKKYLKIDSICLKNQIKSTSHVAALKNISSVILYSSTDQDTSNWSKSEKYIKRAYLLAKKIKDIDGENNCLEQIGILFLKRKKYSNALQYYKNAVLIAEKSNNISKISSGYWGIAGIYFEMKKLDSSLFYFKKRISVLENKKAFDELAIAYSGLGAFYNRTNQYKLGIEYHEKAIQFFKKYSNSRKSQYLGTLSGLSNSYAGNNEYKKAFETLDKTYELNDSLTTIKNRDLSLDLEAKYQTEKKEQEIKLLLEVSKKQQYIYLSILGLLLALGTFLFYGYRNKIKTAQKLNELNELKSRFFANISHEFRTPLTLIKSPVQSLQNEIKDENQKSKLNLIDKNSNRMLELVDQLLELSKIDSGNLKLILKEGNITSFLNSIVESFDYQAKENKLSFVSTIEKNNENHHFDKDVIEKIVTNLLSNAIKYTPENEKIHFNSKIENNQLLLVVSNSGSEIKKEEVSKLFERFYQKKESQQGVGIGLALVKELVDLYQGKIETNVENGILSFTVLLPLQSTNANAIVVTKEIQNPIIVEENENETELPILLLVDDNQDIRNVLAAIFKENYQIFEAENGEQALKIAKKEIPDCIISDVMMPKMDGFEFTKQIKNNELTSFIPVILLTAKTSDQAHLESLQSAADAFLTKPFNNDIVKTTVLQLISERKKLHERYSQELVLRPVDIVINSVDEKFIEKLQVVLDKELANSDFSAEDFSTAVGMSRMQLHRKLKSLLGVSSTEFLRSERLKVATELLKKNNGTIAEIIYAVGFNDTSYFIRCFKEKYNCTPSEYQEKNK